MANRDGKLIERTLKDFSLNISTNGGSGNGGDGYGIIKEACEFENKYRRKVKEELTKVVGSNTIQPCFNTIQDFLSFLKELGVDENKKYTNIFICFTRSESRDNPLTFVISIVVKNREIGFNNGSIPFYQEWSEEDSTFKLIERSFTDEFLDVLNFKNPYKAGMYTKWFRFDETGYTDTDITYSPFVGCEYFDEENEVEQVETYKLDYNILLKWMTLKAIYLAPDR